MHKVIYIAASAYSGSTLLSFLLNTHPKVFTVGHMSGWRYAQGEDFLCSCGERLEACPLFNYLRDVFREEKLPFDFRNFGTEYRVTENNRLNRFLTRALPWLESTYLEKVRDAIVYAVPTWAKKLRQQGQSNQTFIQAALRYSNTDVFVDNSQSPFRLRHLRRLDEIELYPVHLVRDPRGVVFSNKRIRGLSIASATQMWLKQQNNIIRLLEEFPESTTIHHERLCEFTDDVLGQIYRMVGLQPAPFPGDFKANEHHILGNVMRFGTPKPVSKEKWRDELSSIEIQNIEATARDYLRRHRSSALGKVVEYYFKNGRSKDKHSVTASASTTTR